MLLRMRWERRNKQMRKQKWTPKKIHTYLRALIQLLFFLFLPSAFTTAFSGIKTILTQIGSGSPVAMSAFLTAAGAVCLYNCIRPLLLRLCLCIRHLRRCCTRRLSVSLQKSQEKATAFEKKLAKAPVVSEIRHFAGNCSALLLRRIRQPARL